MPALICPRCKARNHFESSPTQQIVTCSCGYQANVPGQKQTAPPKLPSDQPGAVAQPAQQPPPYSPPQKVAGASSTVPGVAFRAFLILMSVVFILNGLNASGNSGFSPDFQSDKRFKTDNAMGATANALEFMVESMARHSSGNTAQWFTLALLCWLTASVERLRYAVERGIRYMNRD